MNWLRRNKHQTEYECCGERLSAYLDCELSAEERAAVEQHLATCEDCRWNLETLRQTVEWTRNCAPVRVPRSFTIPVEIAAPQAVRARRPAWGLPLLQGATALVALLFVVVVAGDLFMGGTAPRSEPQMVAIQATAVMDQASTAKKVQVTQVVELVVAAPTVAVEAAVEMPLSEPAVAKAAPTEPPAVLLLPPEEPAVAVVGPTAAPTGGGVGGGETAVSETMEILAVAAEPSLEAARAAATSTPTVTLELSAAMPWLTQPLTVQVTLTEWMTAEEALELVVTPTETAVPAVYPTVAAAPTRSLLPSPTAVPAAEMEAPEPAPTGTADGHAEQDATTVAEVEEAYNAATPAEAPAALASGPEATAVAAAPEGYGVEQGAEASEEREATETTRGTARSWVIVAEVALGAIFVLLALATVVVMLRRRAR